MVANFYIQDVRLIFPHTVTKIRLHFPFPRFLCLQRFNKTPTSKSFCEETEDKGVSHTAQRLFPKEIEPAPRVQILD